MPQVQQDFFISILFSHDGKRPNRSNADFEAEKCQDTVTGTVLSRLKEEVDNILQLKFYS